MDKSPNIDVEALLQSPANTVLENAITVDVLTHIHSSAESALSQHERKKRVLSSTGSLAEKPPRAKLTMASSQTANGDCSRSSQGDPIATSVLTAEEQSAQQDRRDTADGSSVSGAAKKMCPLR